MVSYKNLFLIKGMSAWLWLSSALSSMWTIPSYITGIVRRWFDPESTTWYLTPHSLFPLSHNYRYGYESSYWRYRPDTNELLYSTRVDKEGKEGKEGKEEKEYRITWLSARTASHSTTKDMDDFLGSIRIRGENLDSLPSTVLLQAWSLYDKRWWSAEATSRLEWIDALAEESSTPCTKEQPVPVISCCDSKKKLTGLRGEDLKHV